MLPVSDYRRYGRQMILDGFGLPGQLKLHNAAVVVVGAGGLGCPALQYLAAAGIGRLGVIDHDRVELSNLQRQVLHNETTLGMFKAESAALAIKRINSNLAVAVDAITEALTSQNALTLLSTYDVILDCTDNAATRYLLSDAAVALGKPLVSGAAQKFEGQLCIYNARPDGPCYRCLFPNPPPPETVGSCSEIGILGVVTGIIGNMQALETIKLLSGLLPEPTSTMLLFNALSSPSFRTIKIRSRKTGCLCNDPAALRETIATRDYVQLCGGPPTDWETRGLADNSEPKRISAKGLHEIVKSKPDITIIDVRPPVEFGICHLPNSKNVPLKQLLKDPQQAIEGSNDYAFVVCRLGNDSQIAADALRGAFPDTQIQDVVGGLRMWSIDVDESFPQY